MSKSRAKSTGRKTKSKRDIFEPTEAEKQCFSKAHGRYIFGPSSAKGELTFSVDEVATQIKKKAPLSTDPEDPEDAIGGSPFYLAAVLEYISAEVLELSVSTQDRKKRPLILPEHIDFAIKNDPELKNVFKKIKAQSKPSSNFSNSMYVVLQQVAGQTTCNGVQINSNTEISMEAMNQLNCMINGLQKYLINEAYQFCLEKNKNNPKYIDQAIIKALHFGKEWDREYKQPADGSEDSSRDGIATPYGVICSRDIQSAVIFSFSSYKTMQDMSDEAFDWSVVPAGTKGESWEIAKHAVSEGTKAVTRATTWQAPAKKSSKIDPKGMSCNIL